MSTSPRLKAPATALLVLALLGLAVSGCGRRGSLEAPNASATPEAEQPADPDAANPTGPDRPFILDPLI